MTPSTTPERQPDESPQRRTALTPHQKRLLAELREIAAITRLDYPDRRFPWGVTGLGSTT